MGSSSSEVRPGTSILMMALPGKFGEFHNDGASIRLDHGWGKREGLQYALKRDDRELHAVFGSGFGPVNCLGEADFQDITGDAKSFKTKSLQVFTEGLKSIGYRQGEFCP